RALLLQDATIQIVALVSERAQVPALCELAPELVLLSTNIAGPDTPVLVKQLLELSPGTQVLLITDGGAGMEMARAVLAGARGILPKPLVAAELLGTIHEIVESDTTRLRRLNEMARQRRAKASQGRII